VCLVDQWFIAAPSNPIARNLYTAAIWATHYKTGHKTIFPFLLLNLSTLSFSCTHKKKTSTHKYKKRRRKKKSL
jgi:hypothetical protein